MSTALDKVERACIHKCGIYLSADTVAELVAYVHATEAYADQVGSQLDGLRSRAKAAREAGA